MDNFLIFDLIFSEKGQYTHIFKTISYISSELGGKFEPCSKNTIGLMRHLKPIAKVDTPFKNLSVSQIIHPELCDYLQTQNLSINLLLSSEEFYTGDFTISNIKKIGRKLKRMNVKTKPGSFSVGF